MLYLILSCPFCPFVLNTTICLRVEFCLVDCYGAIISSVVCGESFVSEHLDINIRIVLCLLQLACYSTKIVIFSKTKIDLFQYLFYAIEDYFFSIR